jgi:hypothetical protein
MIDPKKREIAPAKGRHSLHMPFQVHMPLAAERLAFPE